MQFTDTNIILIASAIGVIILLLTAYALIEILSSSRKKTQEKLSTYKAKFGNTPIKGKAKSIRLQSEETGLAALFSNIIPNKDIIAKRLSKTGKRFTLSQYIWLNVIVTVVALVSFLVALKQSPLLSIPLAVIIGIGLPHMIVGHMVKARLGQFTSQFPEAIDLMVRGLKSGLPVNETIINVGQEVSAPCGEEFQKISDAMRFGTPLEDALWETSARLDTPDFKFFVISLVVQRETGGNLGETLENLAGILRSRQAMKLKIKALSSEAKASAWIVGLLPFIMAGVLLMLNYDYAIILYTEPRAQMAGIVALVWMSLGVFIMAKMIDFDV